MFEEYLRAIRQISEYFILSSRDLEFIAAALLTRNPRILLIGPPESGKTTLVRMIAKILSADYARIVGDPRRTVEQTLLRPNVEKLLQGKIEYIAHPIITARVKFFNEINRFSREVQDALLSLLEEGFIEREGQIYKTPDFVAFADMNPYRGDIDLALKSRFDYSLYLKSIIEKQESYHIIKLLQHKQFLDEYITQQIKFEDLIKLRKMVDSVKIDEVIYTIARATILDFFGCVKVDKNIISYPILDCDKCQFKTGPCRFIKRSGGFRAVISTIKLAKARAFLRQRNKVTVDDIIFAIEYSIPHRIEFFEEYENIYYNAQDFVRNYLDSKRDIILEYERVIKLLRKNPSEGYVEAQKFNSLGLFLITKNIFNPQAIEKDIESLIDKLTSQFTIETFDRASEIVAQWEEGQLNFIRKELISKLKKNIESSILVVDYQTLNRHKKKVKELLNLDSQFDFISKNLTFNYQRPHVRIIRSVSTVTIIAQPSKIRQLRVILSGS